MNNREFKEVRLSLGLTQAEFATQLGLTRETVCRIERCAFRSLCESFKASNDAGS
ncbi:helix-turn-helix domain-containing protein [Salmonella enterica]|uniref:helix-turn-helix transcriptional regulator n=1 Tax=Salmonella enterica TaxID=28901 RepID=UPI000EFC1C74